jgi:phosphorylated adapter RNA export protein
VRCIKILGKKKCLELLYATQDIEDNGGLLTEGGYRRKLPGGVFFQLLKNDPTILKEQKSNIFIEQKLKKKLMKQRKRLQNKQFKETQSKQEEIQSEDKSIDITMENNSDIEEGEVN